MNYYHSKKIKIISFLAMIMVLFIHSFNYTLLVEKNFEINFYHSTIQNIISFAVCRISVPFFFILSAYLFLFNFELTFQSYQIKVKSRVKSLLIPYVFWVLLWSSFFYLISLLPFFNNFINNPIDKNNSIIFTLLQVFQNPICYQFWFIKDLIFLILISPLLYFFIKQIPFIILPLVYINFILDYFEFPFFQNLSLLFFLIGMFIHIYSNYFVAFSKKINFLFIGLLWIFSWFVPEITFYSFQHVNVLLPITILFGILFIWKLYDNISQKSLIINFLDKNSKYSFFLFAFHEPTMISLKKISFAVFGNSNEVRISIYFLIPISVFFLSVFIAKLTEKALPKSYKLLTGGRI